MNKLFKKVSGKDKKAGSSGNHNLQKNRAGCTEEGFINNNNCHHELCSGSCHRQKYSGICNQKTNVGQKAKHTLMSVLSSKRRFVMKIQRLSLPGKAAFTLAEVLITLGIIGVVAAMTLPTLIANYQKQVTLAKLKKAYSVLSQVLERNYYDHGDIGSFVGTGSEVTEQKTRDFFNTYWLPYFDSPEISKEGTFPYGKSVPFRGFDNTTFTTSVTTSYADGRIALTTKDGISYYIFTLRWVDVTDENGNVIDRKMTYAENMQVFVDVDGTKGENKMGKDVFIFQIDTTKNKVNPYGHNLSSSVLERNCPNGNGSYCSARILKEGWKISYF